MRDDDSDDNLSDDLDIEVKLELDAIGELRYLTTFDDDLERKEDAAAAAVAEADGFQHPSMNNEQIYGNPLSPKDAIRAVPSGKSGLVRYALVVPDAFVVDGKLTSGLNQRDFNTEKPAIKPRRGSLPITNSDLMSSLTKVNGANGPRYVFNGVLNGWPSLRHFELIELERKKSLPGGIAPTNYTDYIMKSLGKEWTSHWKADKEGREGIPPQIKDSDKIYRAKLIGPPWSSMGWSRESPGFVFWFEAQHPQGPRVVYGSDIVSKMEDKDDVCIAVHMISHRYATKSESAKDKLTYHSLVLLEWEHHKYATVVELAYLNGIGGHRGLCNWYDDKHAEATELYKSLPPEMVGPWLTTAAELRCYDVKVKNLDEMKEYIETYKGPDERFVDPHFTFSHAARLSYRSRSNIAQYLLNYISRKSTYSEMTRNCQTFAADLCSFLAGKKDVVPYHPINRIEYYNRSHLFLYESNMYVPSRRESLQGRVAK